MPLIRIIVESVFLGIVCAIPGLIISSYLAQKGIVRPGSKSIILGLSILGLIVMRFLFPQIPLWADLITITLAVPSGVFRNDFWFTSRRGRWWWLKDEEHES
jgi:hypothetical protein